MGDVEDAIAKALKKEGITPKPVKISARQPEKEVKEHDKKEKEKEVEAEKEEKREKKEKKEKEGKAEASSSGKPSKRRKHKSDKESSRKKAKLADDAGDGHAPEHKYESEEFDDYEMMNVRGGSPTQHGSQRNMLYYGSGKLKPFLH